MIKLCLVGYGKMGKMLHRYAPQKGFEVVGIIDPNCPDAAKDITQESLNNAEIVIEFSNPKVVLENLHKLIALKQNIVVGTTGWHNNLAQIEKLAQVANIGMVYGANFSLGMNLFSKVVAAAVQVFDHFEDYDLLAWEKHHAQKVDSPSGTAVELAKLILENSSQKNKVVWDRLQRKPEPDELHFASIRGGSIPGTHVIAFDGEADTIELSHVVRSRATFALGALQAAKWLHGKSGVFNITQVIEDVLC
ncbi:MAG: 4-hydroxy-tetrahydrodipicolinate reductase [Candidatus Cloacimonetes bacterium]|jgi:4-hydroxy-tetrahydrodipicolinate reductase|nr:4-hydroxy-tetrahydrodipicolinate reductase [Candidatus Cloacimonadota bacterium]MDY0298510.1 4-hydroxy-tetrahydrodipicolinate reductase [Candidatus Cloacimonadaceae bacterium]MCB5278399.1 4-hydroxy-tetrahydrodipicolinate reductase [Candidatus Cloacimonadota bacterium]MCK9332589.1 4-hydroxy-tetrahydrodipicolinate reductase [Candidatus Cloacimonadota bacterium]MDD2209711.1 4-hydroxy-tetrahydrodipicolinate reductase [Candidatus Cloacimonadota bacterium]